MSAEEINVENTIQMKCFQRSDNFIFYKPMFANNSDDIYLDYFLLLNKKLESNYPDILHYFKCNKSILEHPKYDSNILIIFFDDDIKEHAISDYKENQIKFNLSYFYNIPISNDRKLELEYAAIHEFTHIVQQRQYHSYHETYLPKWITEGTAGYIPYRVSNINILTSNNTQNLTNLINYLDENDSKLLSLDGVNKTIYNKTDSPLYDSFNSKNVTLMSLAYTESYTVFFYMDSIYGPNKTQEFILEINKSENYQEAFNKTLNTTLEEFQIQWQESLKNETLRYQVYGKYMDGDQYKKAEVATEQSPGFNIFGSIIVLFFILFI